MRHRAPPPAIGPDAAVQMLEIVKRNHANALLQWLYAFVHNAKLQGWLPGEPFVCEMCPGPHCSCTGAAIDTVLFSYYDKNVVPQHCYGLTPL